MKMCHKKRPHKDGPYRVIFSVGDDSSIDELRQK